jgi:hypothetical protein
MHLKAYILGLYTCYGFGVLVYKGFSALHVEGLLESGISIASPQPHGKLAMGLNIAFWG